MSFDKCIQPCNPNTYQDIGFCTTPEYSLVPLPVNQAQAPRSNLRCNIVLDYLGLLWNSMI